MFHFWVFQALANNKFRRCLLDQNFLLKVKEVSLSL